MTESTELARPAGAPRPVRAAGASRRAESTAAAFLLGHTGLTRDAYAADLRDFGEWSSAAGIDPLDAHRAHVDAYIRTLELRGRAPATIARRLSTLAGFYRYAVTEGILDRSPVDHVRRPKVGQDSPRLGLERDQAAAFLDAAAASGDRDEALACLLLLNGLRVSEACGADVGDLGEIRGHHVLAVTRKGGRNDMIALAPRTWAVLERYVGERVDGALLMAGDGSRLDRHDAARVVRRLARAAGISARISPHSLRHTAVTLALDAGVPLRDVQDLAGHQDPRTTRRYDRARGSLDRHATYALAAWVAGATPG